MADVSTIAGATGFVEAATEALGQVDILVPNAGGPPPGTFASTPLDAYLPALELNLLSTVAMCEAAVPAMCERGWGRVVAITSVSVRQPIPALILSNTARSGVTAFLKTLALEVAGRGVTVNSVQPGLHATERLRSLYGGDTAAAADGVPAASSATPTTSAPWWRSCAPSTRASWSARRCRSTAARIGACNSRRHADPSRRPVPLHRRRHRGTDRGPGGRA